MVKSFNEKFTVNQEISYNDHFDTFSFPLSDFQKHSIKAIVDGDHSLVCCSTGNGKTVPAIFAIQYFINQGKRVIYTVPIRSLGNQKFYDLSKQFPDITFGLLTGEVKTFPNAQVLIMTQEILMNYLFVLDNENKDQKLQFQIDIQNDLAAVIVDECHFIMDESRGHAWESTFLMLPSHIQLIMLSATLDNPLKLASWIENRYKDDKKEVIISSTDKRIVPLIHHAYLTTVESIFKKVKDKTTQQQIRQSTNKLLELKTENGCFQESTFQEVKRIKTLFENNQVYLKRSHVLNNLAKLLCDQELLPAIFYNFSRKNVEICANEITTNVLEFDSKIPYTIRNEIEQIVRKLPNCKEYMNLPEYERLVSLMEKGIGFHHSGMIPVLKEVVELFISKGHIKILFCTDSFSVGLNCPIKTTVFTGITKFDGINNQYLEPHLYTQCSGRAGRRGIDVIGHVVHCNNIFELPDLTSYKKILCGKPQKLESKFQISYNIILNIIKNAGGTGNCDLFYEFIKKSMIYDEIESSISECQKELDELEKEMTVKTTAIRYLRTSIAIIEKYMELQLQKNSNRNKKRKEIEKQMTVIIDDNKYFLDDFESYMNYLNFKNNVILKKNELFDIQNYIKKKILDICQLLVKNDFLLLYDMIYTFTQKGRIASQLAEIPPLIFSGYLSDLNQFQTKEIIGILSCFTDIRVSEELKIINYKNCPMKTFLDNVNESYLRYIDDGLDIDFNSIVYDLIDDIGNWCDSIDEKDCQYIIQNSVRSKGISIGDFSKAVLKISVISKELIQICGNEGFIELQHKLSQIDEKILKYVCSNQSLYI
jgi:superfamily II RNA helicase